MSQNHSGLQCFVHLLCLKDRCYPGPSPFTGFNLIAGINPWQSFFGDALARCRKLMFDIAPVRKAFHSMPLDLWISTICFGVHTNTQNSRRTGMCILQLHTPRKGRATYSVSLRSYRGLRPSNKGLRHPEIYLAMISAETIDCALGPAPLHDKPKVSTLKLRV